MKNSVLNLNITSGYEYTMHSPVIDLSVTEPTYIRCYRKFVNLANKALHKFEKEHGKLSSEMKQLLEEITDLFPDVIKTVKGNTFIMQEGQWIYIDNKGFEPVK